MLEYSVTEWYLSFAVEDVLQELIGEIISFIRCIAAYFECNGLFFVWHITPQALTGLQSAAPPAL